MPTDVVSVFEDSLSAIDVETTLTTADGFKSALSDAIERPAVGTCLPFEGISLTETEVSSEPTAAELEAAATGVTPAGIGIAEHGSVVIQSDEKGNEPVSLYPPKHVAVVRTDDIVPDVGGALEWLSGEFRDGRNSAVVATGASATGDMGALVEGVHGPETVHVLLLSDVEREQRGLDR